MRAGGDRVVLLHGLARTARSMRRLEQVLGMAGFRPLNWSYNSRSHRLLDLVDQLHGRLATGIGAGERVHFVGHSMGGLLIRGALARGHLHCRVGRVVMIAPPNQGVRLLDDLAGSRFLEWVMGRPIADLRPDDPALQALGVPDAEIGVIAGSRRFHPINPSAYLNALLRPEAHTDGTVDVDSTRLTGMKDFLVIEAHHTFICDEPEVIRQTAHFLENGGFDHGARPERPAQAPGPGPA